MRIARRPASVLVAASLATACAGGSAVARPVPDAEPAVSFAPEFRSVDVVPAGAGKWTGTIDVGGASFRVTFDAGDADRAPSVEIGPKGGDAPTRLAGTRDADGAWCGGQVALALGGRSAPFEVSASVAPGDLPSVTLTSDEFPAFDVDLGGRTFRFVLRDADSDGSFSDLESTRVVFDRDGDGALDDDAEGYDAAAPFDLGTGTWRIARIADDGTAVEFATRWPGVSVRPFVGVGDAAPPLPDATVDGGAPIDLAALRGRRVLLLFWFPTCGPCRREIREIAQRWDAFRAAFDGEVVGVCWSDDAAPALAAARDDAAPFRSVLDVRGNRGGCAAAYQVHLFPSAVVVGPDGRIEKRRISPTDLLGEGR